MIERLRQVIASAYCAVVVLFFVGYYLSVRTAGARTAVDWTTPLLALGVVSLLMGVVIGRSWTLLLPLVSLPSALALLAAASVDDRYRRAAPASGVPIADGWLGFAAVALATAVPAVALGVLLVGVGRRLERRARTTDGAAEGSNASGP